MSTNPPIAARIPSADLEELAHFASRSARLASRSRSAETAAPWRRRSRSRATAEATPDARSSLLGGQRLRELLRLLLQVAGVHTDEDLGGITVLGLAREQRALGSERMDGFDVLLRRPAAPRESEHNGSRQQTPQALHGGETSSPTVPVRGEGG